MPTTRPNGRWAATSSTRPLPQPRSTNVRSAGSTPMLSSIQSVTRTGEGRYRIAWPRVAASAIPSWSGSTEPAVSVPWRSSNERSAAGWYGRRPVTVSCNPRRHPSDSMENRMRRSRPGVVTAACVIVTL